MSWIKDKKQRIVIIISVVIILCGFSLIPLSRESDSYPHDMWSNLIFVMTMAGGGIGAVLSLNIIARLNKQKRNISQNSHTNRLKKKAWADFSAVCLMVIMVPLLYGFMTHADIKGAMGARYFITSILGTGFGIGFLFFLTFSKRKEQFPLFDERELYLIHKAIYIGNNIFIGYTLLVMVAAFYVIGGRGMVPMWTIPLVLYGGMFIAGTVQFLFLMHYAKEDDKNMEGGTA